MTLLEQLREQFELVIKGCACSSSDCKLCTINRTEAMKGLEVLREYQARFELVTVCRRCGGLADPDGHVCGCEDCQE